MRVFKLILFSIFPLVCLSCGQIKLGTGGINESAPSGYTRIAQAALVAQNSKAISGTVAIYFKEAGATDLFIVRLESFKIETTELGSLRLRNFAGTQLADIALQGTSGNINYSVPVSANRPSWTGTTIISLPKSGFPTGEAYGTASYGATNYP